jgi:hypothetical protein
MKWIKNHIFEIVSFFIIAVCILFLWNWVQYEPGKTIYKTALSNLPFLGFCNKVYEMACKISGDSYTEPFPESSSIILDILKLLIASPVIMFARMLIFTKIPVISGFLSGMPTGKFEENIRKEAQAAGASSISEDLKKSLMISEAESFQKSVSYKIRVGIVDVIITVCTLLFSSFIFEKYKDSILNFLSTKTGTLVGIVSIVALFFLYSTYCITEHSALR